MPPEPSARAEATTAEPEDQASHPLPLWRRVQSLGHELGSDWRPAFGAGPLPDPPAEPLALGEAKIVEAEGAFEIRDVGPPEASRFEFFLDGIEYTRLLGYSGTVPLIHGYVAAVIRQRADRSFLTWDLIEEEVLAFPHALLPPDRFLELGLPASSLLDCEGSVAESHPLGLAENGRMAVKLRRVIQERRLARRWAESTPHDGWLLVDGGLAVEPALLKSGRAIGLVKSHRTQFLAMESMSAVLAMNAGERSSVFEPLRPEIGEVYSWYFRLRAPAGHDIYWALARIEGRANAETVEVADQVSRWLLAETAPLSLPDSRWHVLLYPIRDCESYLRARMPTLDVT